MHDLTIAGYLVKVYLITMKTLLLNLAKTHLHHALEVILEQCWHLEYDFF